MGGIILQTEGIKIPARDGRHYLSFTNRRGIKIIDRDGRHHPPQTEKALRYQLGVGGIILHK
jgi:hypothetical protein